MVSSMIKSTSYNADKCLDRTLILPRALLEFLAFSSTEQKTCTKQRKIERIREKRQEGLISDDPIPTDTMPIGPESAPNAMGHVM